MEGGLINGVFFCFPTERTDRPISRGEGSIGNKRVYKMYTFG